MLGAVLGWAQPPAVPPADATAPASETKEPPAEPTTKKAPPTVRIPPLPADKAAQKKAETAKKAEGKKADAKKEEPKIPGVVIARGERGFLGVEIIGSAFKITFYDAKRQKIAPDVTRAVLRWDPKYKVGQERLVLNADADGKSLSSPRSIRPPYNFKLFITLLKEASESEEPVGETHVIDFRA